MRDDFPEDVKRTLAARVNSFCSNPDCRTQTTGPQDDPSKAINVGVAAHITAASVGGPRYDPTLSPEQRRHADNGIWLCQNCAKLIDSDLSRYDVTLLRAWKRVAEDHARDSLGKTGGMQLSANLELFLEFQVVKQDTYQQRQPVRIFVLGLKNSGFGTAKFPSIRYQRSCGITVDHFGIDGCYGFGLPRSPSENEWETFRGGVDHVIHPGETLRIAKLIQYGKRVAIAGGSAQRNEQGTSQWVFGATKFCCEISAEGIASKTVEVSLSGDTVSWPV